MRPLLSSVLAALLFFLTAAAAPPAAAHPESCGANAELWTRSELFFGLSSSEGPVSDGAFTAFLDAEVSTRFSDGLTVLSGAGRWRAPGGETVSEESRLVILLHPSEPGAARRIDDIRAAYKTAFNQQSVLLVQRLDCVSF